MVAPFVIACKAHELEDKLQEIEDTTCTTCGGSGEVVDHEYDGDGRLIPSGVRKCECQLEIDYDED